MTALITPLRLNLAPHHLFSNLLQLHSDAVFLDSSYYHPQLGRYSIISAASVAEVKVQQEQIWYTIDRSTRIVDQELFGLLRELLSRHQPDNSVTFPYFTGGAIGFFSYDFGQYFWPNHVVGKSGDWPECMFRIYDWSLVYDHQDGQYHLHGNSNGWTEILTECDRRGLAARFDLTIQEPESNVTPSEYLSQIATIQNWIRHGEVYQVNLSQQFQAVMNWPLEKSCYEAGWQLYQKLRAVNPAPFSCFMPLDNQRVVLSASPELFFQLHSGRILMRPIKGTAPRHTDPAKDEEEKNQLLHSVKDQAELMMIVDLTRNDLGRVCRYGTINVPVLKTLESYATVHHLVASIEGDLRPGYDAFDVIKAAFPCGSITGAPKLRAMERIHQLEFAPRDIYTGSIGWVDFSGSSCFNVAIRTLLQQQDKLTFNVGGGIVIDSDPQKEFEETLHKGAGLIRALKA